MKTTTKFLAIALLALTATFAQAAPTVTASQATVTVGPVQTYPVPAGPIGEQLVAFIATQSRVGIKDAELANPGWEAKTTGIAPFALLRLVKTSDGTESSVVVNKTGNGSGIVLRVSGVTEVQQLEVKTHYDQGLVSDPPIVYTRQGVQDLLVIALTANLTGVAMPPVDYGFPITAAGPIDLTATFRTVTASSENPGPYSLNAGSNSTAASTLIY